MFLQAMTARLGTKSNTSRRIRESYAIEEAQKSTRRFVSSKSRSTPMRRTLGCLCVTLLLVGCGVESARRSARQTSSPASAEVPTDKSMSFRAQAGFDGNAAEEVRFAAADATAAVESVKPRIIYTADVRIVAEDFSAASNKLVGLIDDMGGYIANASLDRSSGEARSGSWTVRVPVKKYGDFLTALDDVGFVESRSQDSEDVTMEYVDVEARIANLKRLEERFIALLQERTGKLEDVLKVEQELARVRGDIEQSEGRLRYLTNKTDYSTVTIALREQKDYVPPRAPSFGERIATTWSQSLESLRQAGEIAVLAIVAIAPWAVVVAVPVLAVVFAIKLALRRRAIS